MKKDLVLIHGALGSAKQFEETAKHLGEAYNVFVYEFPGHGSRVEEDVEFSIENFMLDLAKYLDKFERPVNVFGFSMGGYVSLVLSAVAPDFFKKIVTLGTKFHWMVEESVKETGKLNTEVLEVKVPQYCAYLKGLHGDKWQLVVDKTKKLMLGLGETPVLTNEYFTVINTETVLMLGELDKMVTNEETRMVQASLPNSSFKILEGFVHPLEKLNPVRLAEVLKTTIA